MVFSMFYMYSQKKMDLGTKTDATDEDWLSRIINDKRVIALDGRDLSKSHFRDSEGNLCTLPGYNCLTGTTETL